MGSHGLTPDSGCTSNDCCCSAESFFHPNAVEDVAAVADDDDAYVASAATFASDAVDDVETDDSAGNVTFD